MARFLMATAPSAGHLPPVVPLPDTWSPTGVTLSGLRAGLRYRQNARRIADEFTLYDAPQRAEELLEGLVPK